MDKLRHHGRGSIPRGRARSIAMTIGIVAAMSGALASSAEATHFRFAHNTWRRVSGNTVEFTSTQAWRASSIGTLAIDFGDGSGSGIGATTTVGTFTDVAGEAYTILQYTVQHTYPNEGPFTASMNGCCRISSLVNAGDASERIETVVDLRAGNQGSPVSSIPVILQMAQGTTNNVALPTADPDLDPITCRMATATESLIPTVASAGGFTLAVSPDCVLSWDTSATVVGQKYAAQVMVEENHAGNPSRVGLDFIIEIVDGTVNQRPDCTGISGQQVVNVGENFQATVTGTDPDGDSLTVSHLGLPPGATLTPPSGTQQASPFSATFEWTPQPGDAGSAYAVTIAYADPGGLQATCAFSITVPLCGDGIVDSPVEECDPGAAGSCSAGEVCTDSCVCAVPTPTGTATATGTDTPTPTATATVEPDTPTPTPTVTPFAGCPSSPVVGCFGAEARRRWILRMTDADKDRRDRLTWRWRGNSSGSPGDIGDPTNGTSYALCLYSGPTSSLVAGWQVPSAADCSGCWKARRRGYVFRSDGIHDGLHRMLLRTDPRRARAQFKLVGRGSNLPLPSLPVSQPLLVQLLRSDDSQCWEAGYSAPARRNTTKTFLDSSD